MLNMYVLNSRRQRAVLCASETENTCVKTQKARIRNTRVCDCKNFLNYKGKITKVYRMDKNYGILPNQMITIICI
jgi:hypothetical protein